jgi:hypothetical protein
MRLPIRASAQMLTGELVDLICQCHVISFPQRLQMSAYRPAVLTVK